MLGDDPDGASLDVVAVDKTQGLEIPESVACHGLKFPEPLKPDGNKDVFIRMQAVFTEMMQPLPDSVAQEETQKMSYKDNLYVLVPYHVQRQQTRVQDTIQSDGIERQSRFCFQARRCFQRR